jgi:hypothetical protein
MASHAPAKARAIPDERERAHAAIAAINLFLPDAEREPAVLDALAAVTAIPDDTERAYGLIAIAPMLPDAKRACAVRDTLAAAAAIPADRSDDETLLIRAALDAYKTGARGAGGAINPFLPDAEREPAVLEMLAAVTTIPDDTERAYALVSLAPLLPDAKRACAVRDALAAAAAIPAHRADAKTLFIRTALDAYKTATNSTVEICELSSDNRRDLKLLRKSERKDEGAMKALAEFFNERNIPDVLRPDLTAQFELLAAETLVRAKAREKAQAPIKPPLPDLTAEQIEAVKQRGKECPWSGRRRTRMNTFEWVRDNYKEWAGKGLLQAHIKAADPELYVTFSKQMERKGLPDWLDVPSEDEAKLRKVTDPQKREALLTSRVVRKFGTRLAVAAFR